MNSAMSPLRSAFDAARATLRGSPTLSPALARFDALAASLDARMRVALVGRVSAGKSTLANALLGGYRAPTGVNELTYNVNWITYGTTPSLTVHFVDGREPEPRDIRDLERLTVRTDNPDPYLRDIAYLKITDPAPYLKAFDLIDTPGLDSVFGADSQNTLRILDGPVDAIVLVFARAVHTQESQLLLRFQGAGVGPINAIGALTRIEDYWSWPDEKDPHAVARRVITQARERSAISELVYQLRPVASLVAAGAARLTEADLRDLTELTRIPAQRLGYRLDSADVFTRREPGDAVPAERRTALYRRLSGYGIMLSCEIIRAGQNTLTGLRDELDKRSGMADFRRALVEHFGNRTEVIKLNWVFGRLQSLPSELGAELGAHDRVLVHEAVQELSARALSESARVRELEVLRAYYDGRLDLSPSDCADLLRVTGEHGLRLHERLGLPVESTVDEMQQVAQQRWRHWAKLDGLGAFAGPTRLAISVLRRTYDRILGELDVVDVERSPR